jgi:hypothetical protein
MSSLVNALHVSRHQPCKLPIEEVLQTVKIKVSTNFPTEPIIRQTPGRLGAWKNFEFLINEESCDACDAWLYLKD